MAFGGIEVVKGVDIDLVPGEVHAIVGENGAGKSTVAKIIAGVHRPIGGSIEVFGAATRLASPRHALELGIALIHQEPLTFPDLEVSENIFVGHQPQGAGGLDWKLMRQRARSLLDELGVNLDPTARVSGLSVADQQMVELAAALSHNAKVLLLDETTASLTPKEVAELFVIVRRLRDQGCAIAFVSHHLEEIFEISDRITILRDGEKVGERLPVETNISEVVSFMVGRAEIASVQDETAKPHVGQPVLRVEGLSGVRFKEISLEVRSGEIVGLAGLVGAGRTDVLNAIFGVASSSAGSVYVNGSPVKIRKPRDAMRHGIALVPEDRQHDGLILPMTIAANATLPIVRQISKFGFRNAKVERRAAEGKARELQVVFKSVDQAVGELSGGNQQKVVIGKWLLTNPRVLLLDEPTRGVDVGAKAEVHRQIRELVQSGLGILMVSSDLPELLALSDRVLVMKGGRIVNELSAEAATPERVMFAATGQVAV
jgi:rhamnose transport system ATP-binding protein